MPWRRPALLAAAALAAAVALAIAGSGFDEPASPGPATRAPMPVPVPGGPPAGPPRPFVPDLERGTYGALVMRRTQLRASPGGPVVETLDTTTRFGSDQVLLVVERRGRWLGVLSEHRPNSALGWIPLVNVRFLREPYTITADLSDREVTVRRDGEVVRRVPVAIGRPGTATPVGRFAVTDALRLTGGGSPYGCCALALTGRQPDISQGWAGGDRLAIHGTSSPASIGRAVSLGCLRAGEADMRWLLDNIPLGTPVTIRG